MQHICEVGIQMANILKSRFEYLPQIRQCRWVTEKPQVYLRRPGQAHCCPMVYNLCCRLVLVIWIIQNRCDLRPKQVCVVYQIKVTGNF